ncbi:MAG: nucleotidyltransferase domain-containing protein [Bryobacterales bacterium]|nr:nucleotidyltransferase domain-containing protein [Bryobacterales bacterium]
MPNLPPDKLPILHAAVDALRTVPNVTAIVLGGSYACGFARPESDLDIGVYYREAAPLSADHIRSAALTICTAGSVPVVSGLYDWGPWVNGGAWIQTPAGKVDFLYKNVDQIQTVIEESRRGIWRHDYDQQPPYGFRSIVLLGETAICVPLYDPEDAIARLKESVAVYPEPLRGRILQEALWGAEFTLHFCRTFAGSADVYNAVGCMARVAQFLVHALFALNRRYFVSDKYANRLIGEFTLRPPDFMARLAQVLSGPGATTGELSKALESLTGLWLETVHLTAGAYSPRYDLKAHLP